MFSYNYAYDFYQEYLKVFDGQINRYEKTKEYMNVNHKYETRVKPKIYIEYLKKKRKQLEKSNFLF